MLADGCFAALAIIKVNNIHSIVIKKSVPEKKKILGKALRGMITVKLLVIEVEGIARG